MGESLSGPQSVPPRPTRPSNGPTPNAWWKPKAHNILLAYHICGDATAIVSDMVETVGSVLELDYKVNMPIKAAKRGRATVLGPINRSGVLASGRLPTSTPRQRSHRHVGRRRWANQRPGCALPPKTPPAMCTHCGGSGKIWQILNCRTAGPDVP